MSCFQKDRWRNASHRADGHPSRQQDNLVWAWRAGFLSEAGPFSFFQATIGDNVTKETAMSDDMIRIYEMNNGEKAFSPAKDAGPEQTGSGF